MDQIALWVQTHREEAVDFLQKIIQIPSETGDEEAIQSYLSGFLEKLGLSVDCFIPSMEELRKHPAFVEPMQSYENRPNVVATRKGAGGGRSLLFNGHVDVIPEGAAENWEHAPWAGDICDGKLYGRGASDMKSGVAAMTMAMKAICDAGITLKGDVILEYVVDEELTGNGTLACVLKGYRADGGICSEASSMCIQPASIGRIWFEIHVKGKAAGIQRRYEGVNGIDLGYIVKQAVAEYENCRLKKARHPLYPVIQEAIPCMIGQFESGSYASAFPDSCLLKGSIATVPGEDSQAVKDEFVSFIQEYTARENEWMRQYPPEIRFCGYFAEPSEISPQSPIVKTLAENYVKVLNRTPVVSGRQGAADIRHLNRYGQTPTVIFGPGMTEQMHANNEWVSIQDYLDSINILAHTILEWCGTAEQVNL